MKPSGIEWIGDIPDDWEVTKISRLYSIQLGKMLQPEKKSSGDTYEPYICAANLSSGTFRLDEVKYMWISEPEKDIYRLKRDDLLVTEGGDVGISSIWKDDISPCYFQNALHRVVPKKGNSNRFLHYWLIVLKSVGYIDLICNKSTIAHFTKEKFAQSLILSIPLQTQQRIADYLDEKCGEIDATIAKQKESIEKLKAYKQSLISETVTKGLDKSAPLKPSGIEWIGDIPDDWEVRKLLSIFKEHKDRNKNLEEQNLLSLSYGKIKRKDINNNDGLLPASFETYNIVENGDIVFRLTDLQNDKRSLRTGIVTQRGIITSAYVTIRPKIRLDSRFFHYLYHMYDICKVFYGMGDGVRQGMGFEDLKNIPTLIPPLKTQQKIADYLDSKCSQIDKYITEKQNIIQKLDAYKKSLIFECVTGKFVI